METSPVQFTTASVRTQVSFSSGGSGPPIVFFNDFWSHAQFFWEHDLIRRVIDEFAADHAVIVIDLPGCGLSEPEMGWLSAERLTDVIRAAVVLAGQHRRFPADDGPPSALQHRVIAATCPRLLRTNWQSRWLSLMHTKGYRGARACRQRNRTAA